MIDAKGREKLFVANIQIEVETKFAATFKEDEEMQAYRQQLEDQVRDLIKNFAPLHGANVHVSVPSYMVGTVESLKNSGAVMS